MARIAAAAVSGTLSSSVSSSDTILESDALANLPAISGGDYAAITIGYDRAGGVAPETVWVTAHAANATSATIVRAREGTTARAWSSGAVWVHGPTPEDRRVFNDGTFTSSASPVLVVDALPSGADGHAFQVWCEQALGRLLRFSIENNYSLSDALCDVNFRNSVVEIGSDDAAVSIAGTQFRLFKPTGDTSNALTYYRPGSRTLVAFGVNSAGTVVIGVGGQASVAAQIETAGAANPRWDISEFGAQRWGAGGASALDTTLARAAAGVLEVTGKIRQTGTPTANTDLATKGYVDSVSGGGGGFGFGESVTSQAAAADATGATSSITAFHQARDAAGVGGVVHVPRGDWLVPDLDLSVNGQRWLLQPGARLITSVRTKHVVTISGDDVRLTAPNGGGRIDGRRTATYDANERSGVIVTGDRCEVDNLTVVDACLHGIYVQNAQAAQVHHNYVSNSWSNGIFCEILLESAASVDVEGLILEHNWIDRSMVPAATARGGGIKIHGDNNAIEGTHELRRSRVASNYVRMPDTPTQSGANCIEVWGLSPYSIIADNHTYHGRMGISIDRADYCSVVGNNVFAPFRSDTNGGVGIECAGSVGVAITGNTVDGANRLKNGITAWSANEGVAESSGAVISGNVIARMSTAQAAYGIAVQASALASPNERVVVSGNSIETAFAGSQAIRLLRVRDASITGNTISGGGVSERAIWTQTCAKLTITGNTMRRFATSAIHLAGADGVTFTVDDIAVTGNVFDDCTKTLTIASGANAPTLGSRIRFTGNSGNTAANNNATGSTRAPGATQDVDNLLLYVGRFRGTGAPALFAGIGSTYIREDASSADTALYVKHSDASASTSWTALTST